MGFRRDPTRLEAVVRDALARDIDDLLRKGNSDLVDDLDLYSLAEGVVLALQESGDLS